MTSAGEPYGRESRSARVATEHCRPARTHDHLHTTGTYDRPTDWRRETFRSRRRRASLSTGPPSVQSFANFAPLRFRIVWSERSDSVYSLTFTGRYCFLFTFDCLSPLPRGTGRQIRWGVKEKGAVRSQR